MIARLQTSTESGAACREAPARPCLRSPDDAPDGAPFPPWRRRSRVDIAALAEDVEQLRGDLLVRFGGGGVDLSGARAAALGSRANS